MLVSSRQKTEKNYELVEKHGPSLGEKIMHITASVYFISISDEYDANKRGGGAVLAVNLTRSAGNVPPEKAVRAMPAVWWNLRIFLLLTWPYFNLLAILATLLGRRYTRANFLL